MQHRDACKLLVLKQQIVHVRRAAPPVADDEDGRLGKSMTANGHAESHAFKNTDWDRGDDKQRDPQSAGPLSGVKLPTVTPKQPQPVPQG